MKPLSFPDSTRKPRILVIDDDDKFGRMMAHIACNNGLILNHFPSLEDAGQELLADADVVVIDYDLGGESGVGVSRTLERHHRQKPVLLISASQDAMRDTAWPANIRSFVAKSMGPFSVLDSIRSLVLAA